MEPPEHVMDAFRTATATGDEREQGRNAETPAFDEWAVVELFGHKRLGGRVRQVELFGGAFLRIDVPDAADGASTHLYGAAAVYGVHPTSEAIARSVAAHHQVQPVQRWELPQQPRCDACGRVGDHDPNCPELLAGDDEDDEEPGRRRRAVLMGAGYVKIFYDTEFLEDGRTIELISIGMVAEDGRELYAVAEEIEVDPLRERIRRHPWLMANVVPHLPLHPNIKLRPPHSQFGGSFALDGFSNVVMPRRMIRNLVREFILSTPDPQLWAWYGAYDHVVYAQLFGPMASLPEGLPMYTSDVRTLYALHGDPPVPEQAGAAHNALDDAHHVKAMYDALDLDDEEGPF